MALNKGTQLQLLITALTCGTQLWHSNYNTQLWHSIMALNYCTQITSLKIRHSGGRHSLLLLGEVLVDHTGEVLVVRLV